MCREWHCFHPQLSITLSAAHNVLCIAIPFVRILIDTVLQEYNTMKRAEHALKSVRYDGTTVSVVDPAMYSGRFVDFMRSRVFVPEAS